MFVTVGQEARIDKASLCTAMKSQTTETGTLALYHRFFYTNNVGLNLVVFIDPVMLVYYLLQK